MTTNPRGEVRFKVNKNTWTLLYDIPTLADLEDEVDLDSIQILARLSTTARTRFLIKVFTFGLKAKHGDVPPEEVGALMTALTGHTCRQLVLAAFTKAFPEPEAGETDEDPPKAAAAGTGAASIEAGAASA